MASSFEDLCIVDNFYQTSAFYPMPTILIGTLNEDGSSNLGAYSLCFPYYIAGKEADIQSVMYAANRMDDKIKFSKEACQMLVRVPRIFLKVALQGCVDWAKENHVTLITPVEMKIINDKRAEEKKRR
jgi:hypothetical protein